MLIAEIERGRQSHAEQKSVGALVAIAYIGEEQITKSVGRSLIKGDAAGRCVGVIGGIVGVITGGCLTDMIDAKTGAKS